MASSLHRSITGPRICLYSTRTSPLFLLYSDASSVPQFPPSKKPVRERCVFDDAPAKFRHPGGPFYCSCPCGTKLLRQDEERSCTVLFPAEEERVSMEMKSEAKMEAKVEAKMKGKTGVKVEGKAETKMETKTGGKMEGKTETKTKAEKKTESPAPVAQSAAMAQPRPLIVTSTTPDGKVLQYQLNQARSVLVNTQNVNFPISANQVYYLQMEVNGQVVATPHLMCGTTVKNGCMYYCMTPMVLISSSVKSWHVCSSSQCVP